MDRLNRILVIDDDESLKEEIEASFNEETIEVVFSSTKDDALKKIDAWQHFDAIILDWFLEDPDSSILSQLVLSHLYGKSFVPVFIWSKHIDDFNSVREAGSINYPNILIEGLSKDEITIDKLRSKIHQLFENSLTARISKVYRESITINLEKTFFELSEIPNEDLASILKVLIGSEENIDWSNDFILNLIHRKLLADNAFTEKLRSLVLAAADNLGTEELAKRRKIVNRVLYFHATPGIIRCGDIVVLKAEENVIKYGIVVTPDCDIEQRNTKYLEMVEMRSIDDPALKLNSTQKRDIQNFKHDSFYYFPSLLIGGNLNNDFVAILKSKFIVEAAHESNEEKYPKVPQKLNYDGKFLCNGREVLLKHICAKSNPYKSDFLQKLYTNNSRVGTPDIKELLNP